MRVSDVGGGILLRPRPRRIPFEVDGPYVRHGAPLPSRVSRYHPLMRWLLRLTLCLLAASAASATGADPAAAVDPDSASATEPTDEPGCLAPIRAELQGVVTTTTFAGHTIRGKRLVIERGGVTLVLDYAVFEATTRAFLKGQAADRFPEEREFLQRFAKALARADEIDADRIVTTRAQRARFDYRLAEVIEQGAFELRPPPGAPARGPGVLVRVKYDHHCEPLCGSGGRMFFTDSCQQIVQVLDWVS